MHIAHIDETKAKAEPAPSANFEGEVRIQRLFDSTEGNGQALLMVHFSPGGRTRPHIHERGQILHIVYGTGVVATENEKRIVTAGDVVIIPPGVWHWHGATMQTTMSHLAIQSDQPPTNWDVDLKDWATGYETV